MVVCSVADIDEDMQPRKYTGHIYYVPAPGYEGTGTPFHGGALEASSSYDSDESCNNLLQKKQPPADSMDSSTSQWREMEGPFILIWLNNVPFSNEALKPAPNAKVVETTKQSLVWFWSSDLTCECRGREQRYILVLEPDFGM